MKSINPYINFNGNCEEAFEFYQSIFGGELQVIHYNDMGETGNIPEESQDNVANAALPISKDHVLLGSDDPFNQTTFGDNTFLNIEAENAETAEHVFNKLTEDGEVKVALEETEWAEKFGMCADRFGVNWMINYTGDKDI